jgi:hypothetical protein
MGIVSSIGNNTHESAVSLHDAEVRYHPGRENTTSSGFPFAGIGSPTVNPAE